MSTTYNPPLFNLLNTESIPEELSFFKDGIENLLEHLSYKDLHFYKSVSGNVASYNHTVVPNLKVALEIPGTGGLAFYLLHCDQF